MITILIPRHTLTCFSILQTHRSWNLVSVHFFGGKKVVARTIRYVASMVLRTLPRLLPRSSQPCTVASTSKETTWGTHGVGRGVSPREEMKRMGGMAGESWWWGYCAMIVHVLWNSNHVSRNNQIGLQESIRALAVAVALALCHTGRSWLGGH